MNRWIWASVPLSFVVSLVVVAQLPTVATHQVELNGHTFTLPLGFEIELAAGPPLVQRPIVADFDEDGRLYVADSDGPITKADIQLQKKPHRIVRLSDSQGNGRFDRASVFADQMQFPEGTLWHAGSLYVATPPSIWKLTDTRGNGVADQRTEWFQGKTLTGCANDLHGPYLGPDGWIYWCKGAFAQQTYERPGKPPFVTRASHIFRCRPDGSGVEPVMTGGMDNPIQVAFTPAGERIFTTTFFQHPSGGHRDGLIHAIYGGIYGKDHDPIYEHKWTGPALMPVLTHLGPAAPCGLLCYEGTAFGERYQGNLFTTLFNMQKVTRHVLEPAGATFKTRDEDFLVSSNRDFHPTHLLEDADGSLLVVDTGGWYKLCCPTSQLLKPDVMGAIYRIRRTGAPAVKDVRGRQLQWATMSAAELAALLDDPRPVVRRRALAALADKGAAAMPALEGIVRNAKTAEARRNGVWTATRIDQPAARAVVRLALADADESVRQAALHSVSLRRDTEALPALLTLLKQESAHNRRAAAEAIGRIGNKSAVPALLEALGQPADRVLEHSLTYALIEIADRDGTAAGLKSADGRVRRAALMALDQMDGSQLGAAAVAAELDSTDGAMKETASWIVGRHPEWGNELAGFFRGRLAGKQPTPLAAQELARQLGGLARAPSIQELLAERLRDTTAATEGRLLTMKCMAQATLKETPKAWLDALTEVLSGTDAELVREAVTTTHRLGLPKQPPEKLVAALLQVGARASLPDSVRLAALAAIPGSLTNISGPLFTLACANLDGSQASANRTLAADVLARAKLTSEQLLELTERLKTVSPLEMNRVLEAFGQSTDEKVGRALIAALKAAPAQAAVRLDRLRPILTKYGPKLEQPAEELYASINADAAKDKARLEQLLANLKPGDVRRGQAVFNSQKAACSSCHAVGYLGGNVGPDLTRVGQVRTERDLLESIVFPSASFVQGYEPMVVTTKDGKVLNGLIRKNAPEEILLVLGANQEVRIARDDIDEIQPSKVSVMPAGLEKQVTAQELADLVAFLKACK